MQYQIKTKPLLPGMNQCIKCKNEGKRSYTEIAEYAPYDRNEPKFAVKHWCDTGGDDDDWIDAKRYCHGYVGPSYMSEMFDSKNDAINAWNLVNKVSWFRQLFG